MKRTPWFAPEASVAPAAWLLLAGLLLCALRLMPLWFARGFASFADKGTSIVLRSRSSSRYGGYETSTSHSKEEVLDPRVEFIAENGGGAGVRLRKGGKDK